MKKNFYTELAYVFGLIALAAGTALMEAADFGVSMVVAPAYLIHLKLSQTLPFFSFGMAEYTLQAFILALMCIVLRRVKLSCLFSFVTALIYGFMLDGAMLFVALIPAQSVAMRAVFYLVGVLGCSIGVSLVFHTYIPPEAYELFVKELSAKFGVNINIFKTCYDCVSCLIGVILSFAFFGMWHFEGVKLGTVVCALVNGYIISLCTRFFEKRFEFRDALDARRYF